MKKNHIKWLLAALLSLVTVVGVFGQGRETFSGNVIKYGSGVYTGVRTANFTFTINGWTPKDQAERNLELLKSGGQDALLNAVRNEDLGSLSFNNDLRRTINAVVEDNSGGQRKIYAIFERWEQFAEIRGGYRSLDYPFGYVELTIDRNGKGTGKYFAAAKIRWKEGKKGETPHVEIEDYATFPAELVNVKSDRARP
jgi:hypothetical protein